MYTPPAKRQRTENAPATRSEMWFSDGNVVLQAANTQFRVHWGVLALHSTVFRDMQSLPQPPDQPSIDGCSIVEVFDDPGDVQYLLKALYHMGFYNQKELPFPAIGAFVRMGRKYDLKVLLDSAVVRLTSSFPTTLAAYDETLTFGFTTIEADSGLDFDTIPLASENDILSVLPSAYYSAVARSSLEELYDGIPRDNGTMAQLPEPYRRRCVFVREILLVKQFQESYPLAWARKWEFGDCTNSAQCRTARETFYAESLDTATISALDVLPNGVGHWCKMCSACTKHAKKVVSAGRNKLWDELPAIFGLPAWNELKNLDM
ncbi:hypothetical protein K438DRAFT_2007554 [Mycena galopus ATCC 62051]|nr:hypothetical protein K438DRAFT_2007554 [Mycena galopus ATCC 62051]